jgi:ribosomal protein S18 acetylase RimI-like enzyme
MAAAGDTGLLIDILADAFRDDPVLSWFSAKETYPRFAFGMTLPSCLPHRHTHVTLDGSGVASWLPPGVAMKPSIGFSTFWEGVTQYGILSLMRAFRLFTRLGKFHPHEPHYYLFALGTRPAHQGRGVGSALMREVTSRCDENGAQAYLENSKPENLSFYRRHGFEVMDEIQIGNGGPQMWPMLRKPR